MSDSRVFVFQAIFIVAIFTGLSLWTNRNLDWFLTLVKGEVVDAPMWMAVALSIVLNAIIFAANLIAEIVRFVI